MNAKGYLFYASGIVINFKSAKVQLMTVTACEDLPLKTRENPKLIDLLFLS